MLGEKPSQYSLDDSGRGRDAVEGSPRGALARGAAAAVTTSATRDSEPAMEHAIETVHDTSNIDRATKAMAAPSGKRWWLLAAVSALLLTGLTIAGIYLVTKKPSTVDQLVILTVPSGAEIKLDSKDYGHSPVKLEQLAIGTYTLTISKEGYESIVQTLSVAESGPVEFKLKPTPPAEAAGLPPEEQIKQYQDLAEAAFARGFYGVVYEGSALYYADNIQTLDPRNPFSAEMRERIRKAAHQSAQNAISRGDLGQAQEVYNFLMENYPVDEEARAAAARLESQLARALGQVRELVRKADEALLAGRLIDPPGKSAYFYSKQALAIDRQNEKARQIRNQVKETLASAGEQAFKRGDVEAAIKQLEDVGQLFPEDKQSRARVREIKNSRAAETAKVPDTDTRRLNGLEAYRAGNFDAAIPDLQHAMVNGRSTPDVVFALARSYLKTGQLDHAETYFKQIKPSRDDEYRSSIAALGDIAFQKGDSTSAVEQWKEARQSGGSTLYSVAILDDKIERVEKKQREKAAEPTPLTLQVKHTHGGLLGGSCTGTLTINATGVRYDGQHVFASNLVGTGVSLTKDEMEIKFQGSSQKFRVTRAEAERVREAIARYQQTYSPVSK
ncbi:MAG TPA: PEGA domain-containing protein [Blastocatellia bacterium]|nr:PEGA domain-containing protein [Blastocatellia bacterium]